MIKEAEHAIELLDKQGTEYKIYNDGVQINAKDLDGVIHSFYPTTGTVIIHASNDRSDRRKLIFRDKTAENFAKAMRFEKLTNFYFKEEK